MSNTAPAKQVCKPKKLPFVIMCILSAIVAVLNVLLCVLVPKYYTTINSFLYKGPDADKVAAFRQASADMTQKVESEGIVMLLCPADTLSCRFYRQTDSGHGKRRASRHAPGASCKSWVK